MPDQSLISIPLDIPDVRVLQAVQETLPEATIVVDRFHVAGHYRAGVDTLRTQEVRRLRVVLPVDQQDDLTRLMWLIRAHPDDRDATDQERLERFLVHSPTIRQAPRLRDELTAIFDTACSKADGLQRIRHWRQRVVTSGLTCFDRFLTLLDTWQDLIANYFKQHQTSGFVEGLNTKLKVLKRRCYGLCNEAGATVYVTGRTIEEDQASVALPGTIQQTAAEAIQRGGQGIAIRCDHRNDDDVQAVFARIRDEHGRLDVIVNNVWGGYKHFNNGTEFWNETDFWTVPISREIIISRTAVEFLKQGVM